MFIKVGSNDVVRTNDSFIRTIDIVDCLCDLSMSLSSDSRLRAWQHGDHNMLLICWVQMGFFHVDIADTSPDVLN